MPMHEEYDHFYPVSGFTKQGLGLILCQHQPKLEKCGVNH